MALEITEQNYAELAAQGKPMVIDFSAAWCGPCRKMAPIIDDMADKFDGQVLVGTCDVDDNEELAAQFGVRNIPVVFFVKDGKIADKLVGAVPASQVEEKINALL